MEMQKAIETLRNMASKSSAANDLFHSFATRQRARGQLTVRGIQLRMKKEGFNHKNAEYADILKGMADCGIGKLKRNSRGTVYALTNITIQLQSLGKSIIERKVMLKNNAPRHRYSPIKADPAPVVQAPVKQQVLTSLATASSLIEAIVKDTSVNPDTKVKLIQTVLEAK